MQFVGFISSYITVIHLKLLLCLLTPWSTVLEKLTGSQLVYKLPLFYATLRFITAFTKNSNLYLILNKHDQVHTLTSHFLNIHLNIILHLRLGLPSGLFHSNYPSQNPPTLSSPPYVLYAPPISFSI
jgi:hypothetical protein